MLRDVLSFSADGNSGFQVYARCAMYMGFHLFRNDLPSTRYRIVSESFCYSGCIVVKLCCYDPFLVIPSVSGVEPVKALKLVTTSEPA